MSMLPVAWPATPSVIPPSSGEAARRSATSCSVETLVGPSAGRTWKAATVRSAEVPIGATATTSSKPAIARGDLHLGVEGLVLGRRPGEVRDDEQRAVRAVAELVGDDVVGAVLGRLGPFAVADREAEAHRRRGDGDHAEDGDGQHDAGDRGAGGHGPGGRDRRRSGLRGEPRGLATAEDPRPDEAQQGGRQGHRDEHGDRDARRADGAHQAEERDAGHVEREQRDDHRGAGEHDRVAGGAGREGDGFADRSSRP